MEKAPNGTISPTQFHNSVHNAAAGYWHIAAGSAAPSLSVGGHDGAFAAGLLANRLVPQAEAQSGPPPLTPQIINLFSKTKQDGYSVIPLAVYFKSSRVKVEIGLCKGKKLHDKRDSIAARDAKREMDRAMKERNR